MHLLLLLLAADANLLAHRGPWRAVGVIGVDRLTDGIACRAGDPWTSPLTAVFRASESYVTWDLGEPRPIAAIWLQADANDAYEIAGSQDGNSWTPIWTAPAAGGDGMRPRHTRGLSASARYLRVRPAEGDGAFSISELQVFAETPAVFPPRVTIKRGAPIDEWLHSSLMIAGVALVFFVFATRGGMRRWLVAAFAIVPVGVIALYFSDWSMGWPFEQRTVSLVRGIVAVVAALVVAREAFAPRRWPAHRAAVIAVLALCGVTGVASFYNLGQPQFFDQSHNRRTFVHVLDLRQYYLTAKYFRELGYRHLYEADVAAYLDDHPQVAFESLAHLTMRDLRTHDVSTIGEQREGIESIKSRFTPERWDALRRDERYFRDVMGTNDFFRYMIDYGGNATPVWIQIARGLFSIAPASESWFFVTGLLDALLLLIAFVAIGRAFGVRTMLVCMVVFGANDYIMYGSNWAGATLRHDWLAYLALGVCALKRQRWALGGVMLALATMIRAFPALALCGVAVPAAWDLVQRRRERLAPTLRVLGAAAATIILLFAISTALSPAGAWRDWLAKVHLLNAQGHASHVSLRSVIGGADHQARMLIARAPVFAAAVALYVIAVLVACRKQSLDRAALLGLSLVPIVFAPANYYIHFIFLLPMLGGEAIWLVLLALCALQYFTTWIGDLALHFYLASVLLMAALLAMLGITLRSSAWLVAWWAIPAKASRRRIVSSSSPAPSATTACDPQVSPSP